MKKAISLVTCAVMLLCCGCFAGCGNQSADNQKNDYSKAEGNGSSYLRSSITLEGENTTAKEFFANEPKEIGRRMFARLRANYIDCQQGDKDEVIYFKKSNSKYEEDSWLEVNSLTKKITFGHPDSDYLKKYFNKLVPLWDDKNKGNEIVDELTSKIYEDDDGYRYNIIKKNGVEYQIHYNLKYKYQIDYIYVIFDNGEQSSK